MLALLLHALYSPSCCYCYSNFIYFLLFSKRYFSRSTCLLANSIFHLRMSQSQCFLAMYRRGVCVLNFGRSNFCVILHIQNKSKKI